MNKSTLNTRHPGFKLITTTEKQLLTADNIKRVKQLKVGIFYFVGIDKLGNLLIGHEDNLINGNPEHFTIGHLFKDDDQTIKEFYGGCETYVPSEGEFYHRHPYCPDKRKRPDEIATAFIKQYFRYYKSLHRRQAAQSFRTVTDSVANLVDINTYIDYVAKNIEHFNLDDIKVGLLTANIERFAQQLLARQDLHSILTDADLVCFLDSFYFEDIRNFTLFDIKKKKLSLQLLQAATDTRNRVTEPVRKECHSYYYYLRRQYSVRSRTLINQLIS